MPRAFATSFSDKYSTISDINDTPFVKSMSIILLTHLLFKYGWEYVCHLLNPICVAIDLVFVVL